jgi:hypothetical protein
MRPLYLKGYINGKPLWRPRFLITVINANDRIGRSNGQP